MKGQYLAIETILTVAIGISVAVGTVSVFTTFQDRVLTTGERAQAQAVRSQILNGVQTLSGVESGRLEIQLPDRLSGQDYTVDMDDEVRITSSSGVYVFRTGFPSLQKSGSSSGGTVTLIKRDDEIILRSS